MADFGFCNGILWDEGYGESTCPKRDNCQYYDEFFFVRGYNMDQFEQLHNVPGKECTYFIPREVKKERSENDDIFGV